MSTGRELERQEEEGSVSVSYYERAILDGMADAEEKAWKSLAGYKFWQFGYHCGRWVNYNALLNEPRPNPFRETVKLARTKTGERGTVTHALAHEGELWIFSEGLEESGDLVFDPYPAKAGRIGGVYLVAAISEAFEMPEREQRGELDLTSPEVRVGRVRLTMELVGSDNQPELEASS